MKATLSVYMSAKALTIASAWACLWAEGSCYGQGHRVLRPHLHTLKHIEVLQILGELLHVFRHFVSLEGCRADALLQRLGMHDT